MAIDVTTTVTTSLDPPLWFYRTQTQEKIVYTTDKTLRIQSSHFDFRM